MAGSRKASKTKEAFDFEEVIKALNGRHNSTLRNPNFWTAAGGQLCLFASSDEIHFASYEKRLHEALAEYFLRLQSKQELLTDDILAAFQLFLTSMAALLPSMAHTDFQQVLWKRGVITGFCKMILNYSRNDDKSLIVLSLCMVFCCRGCSCCPKLEMMHYEQAFEALKDCCEVADKIHPILRQELSFAISQIIDEAKMGEKLFRASITHGLVQNGLITYVLKHTFQDYVDPHDMISLRLRNATGTLLFLYDLHPSLTIYGVDQLFLDFALESFQEKHVMHKHADHGKYCTMLRGCQKMMGDDVFRNKFMRKLVKVFPKRFFKEFIPDTSSEDMYQSSLENYIHVAEVFDRVGSFDAWEKLASVVVTVFGFDEPSIEYKDLLFLRKIYGSPDFNLQALKRVPECTRDILTNLCSALSGKMPEKPITPEDRVLIFKFAQMRSEGKLQIYIPTVLTSCSKCKHIIEYRTACEMCGNDETAQMLDEPDTPQVFKVIDFPIVPYRESDAKAGRVVAKGPAKSDSSNTASGSKSTTDSNKNEALFTCQACDHKGSNLLMCGRCQSAYYCNQDCQRADWKKGHKQVCKPQTEDSVGRAKKT